MRNLHKHVEVLTLNGRVLTKHEAQINIIDLFWKIKFSYKRLKVDICAGVENPVTGGRQDIIWGR